MTTSMTLVLPTGSSQFLGAVHVVLVAEGFPATELRTFTCAVDSFAAALLDTPPFGLLRVRPSRVRVWSLALQSTDYGAALGSTPGNTPLGATFDPSIKVLSLDPVRVDTLLNNTKLPSPFELPLFGLAQRGIWSSNGIVIALLPAIAGGQPLTADLDTSVRPVNETPSSSPPWMIATTIDLGWERVVVEAMARCFGLEDEWSRSEPEYTQPDPSTGASLRLKYAPNLHVGPPPTGAPGLDFPWYKELDTVARSKPLTVVGTGEVSPTRDEPIQLFEGGGRYQAGVYRSSSDCLMRRRIGSTHSPRYDSIDFCVVCRRFLTRSLTDTQPNFRRISLGNQQLMLDQVDRWQKADRFTSGFPRTISYSTASVSSSSPWWAFDINIGAQYGGLSIQNLLLREQPADSLASETVAEFIEFRDIAVELDNGEKAAFDFAEAFSSTQFPPQLQLLEAGVLGTDHRFQRGVKLTLRNELRGRCPVEVDFAFTVRGTAADIDPSEGITACKFFPQLGIRYLPGGPLKVKRFRACVRVVCNNRLRSGTDHVHGGMAGAPDETTASMFTDTNRRWWWLRRWEVMENNPIQPVYLSFPLWTNIMDYHKPDIRQETEIRAVYGPLAPKSGVHKERSATLHWPPGTTYEFTVEKTADQGQYDNIHLHASMGTDPFHPAAAMVHAPGCAEACIHLHWRWGIGGGAWPFGSAPFRGWNRSVAEPTGPHCQNTAPLIPSNQDLTIAITNPATNRTDPWAAVVTTSSALDPKRKAVWYTVDISEPVAGETQVVLEMGISFAFAYNFGAFLPKHNLSYLRWLTRPASGADTRSDSHLQHLLYSVSRWFFRHNLDGTFTSTSEQIPAGTVASDTGVVLEDL